MRSLIIDCKEKKYSFDVFEINNLIEDFHCVYLFGKSLYPYKAIFETDFQFEITSSIKFELKHKKIYEKKTANVAILKTNDIQTAKEILNDILTYNSGKLEFKLI